MTIEQCDDHKTGVCAKCDAIEVRLYGRIAALEAENARLRAGLQMIGEGSTPWIDGYHAESWEVFAEYAKQLLVKRGE